MRTGRTCPVCSGADAATIFAMKDVPVNSVVLVHDEAEAKRFPVGEIDLVACPACGFAWNAAFDLSLVAYGDGYEATQAFSPTFNSFHERLASDMVDRFDLKGRRVIEIGCGQGEFLNLLRQQGIESGLGFDPAYDKSRPDGVLGDGVEVIADVYDERYQDRAADFIVCKMTLEHIPQVVQFLRTVRRSLDAAPDSPVVFQIPNLEKILEDTAFWDVYYEHCSYFTPSSLTYAFEHAGFTDTTTWTDYDDQYLLIEGRPGQSDKAELQRDEGLAKRLDTFATSANARVSQWASALDRWVENSEPVVLWGGGSKAVAFLSSLGDRHKRISAAVDVNPHKWGSYLPRTALPVIGPAELGALDPAHVVVMNPIYIEEITASLREHGVEATVHSMTDDPSAH